MQDKLENKPAKLNTLILTWGVTRTVLGIYPPQCAQTPQDSTGPSPSDGGNRTARISNYYQEDVFLRK